MSFHQRLAEWYLRATRRPTSDTAVIHRRYIGREYPSPAPITRGLRALCTIREDRVIVRPVHTFTPRHGGSAWHLVYMHGGAFVNALTKFHWDIVEALIRATGATVTVPIYPLAPEHQYMETFRLLEEVYRGLLQRVAPERIILAGDSAGGNLALTQALYYREHGLPLPGHIILFSPWLDVTMSNSEARALEPKDVMLRVEPLRQQGRWWAGATDLRTPIISPIFGDLRGLPPLQVYQGTHDIFLPDARRLRDLVTAAGGEIQYYETPGGFHVFMGATFTPEARWVFQQIAGNLGPGSGS
jgi:epsilon-lactone hydrolase